MKILEHVDKQVKPEIYFLVLAKQWNRSEYITITSNKISIKGKNHHIRPKRCGFSLSKLLKEK